MHNSLTSAHLRNGDRFLSGIWFQLGVSVSHWLNHPNDLRFPEPIGQADPWVRSDFLSSTSKPTRLLHGFWQIS